MVVLGIETSCDETAASVINGNEVLSDVIWSQNVHQRYGGVVPELASRAHIEKVVSCVRAALDEAEIDKPELVSATAGPGLIGAVLVGFNFGKSLSIGWEVPFLGVNHLEGHLLSPLLNDERPEFPFLSMVVSGGHTTLYLANSVGDYQILSQTIDDAAGEAYDKTARLMGLSYPGGPIIDKLAAQGNAKAVAFPRTKLAVPKSGRVPKTRVPLSERTDLDVSFSGLKTAVRQYLERTHGWEPRDVAASFQAAVLDVLIDRIVVASERTGVRRVAIGGGVAANSGLRSRLLQTGLDVYIPPRSRCTDNGSMIALVGSLRYQHGERQALGMGVRPRWPVGEPLSTERV